ncbi:MAG: tRNA epoxyqueuosine(34) reductase QueG [Thermoanaerobaculia bacterium]|nr:tRNA epoxyqueuosine(34) reductase QueG [Thermoanaerobaculia bacterium]
MTLSAIWSDIEREALRLGAMRVGATPLIDQHAERFAAWLDEGHEAGMTYLRRNLGTRRNPLSRFPWGRSVVVILVPYGPERPHGAAGALSGGIARYAQGDDYHGVVEEMLRGLEAKLAVLAPGTRSWRYVDTGPFSDRSLGAQAGLGWIGKNAMLIDPELGSYFFIGTLVTSLDHDLDVTEITDRCGECTRCVDACPTGAILPDRFVDSRRCISYLTIEHRGAIDPALAARLAGNVFGCDICQEACPWNAHAPEGHSAFQTRSGYTGRPVTDLLTMSQAEFSTLFSRSAVKRAKRAGMIRNAILAAEDIPAAVIGRAGSETDEGIVAALALRRSTRR